MKVIINKAARVVAAFLPLGLTAACGSGTAAPPPFEVVTEDSSDQPLRGSSELQQAHFIDGDAVFGRPFRPTDGIGPLYIRTACEACHDKAGRGPGVVEKIALVELDGHTPLADQSPLEYGHTLRPYTAGGASTPIRAPATSTVGMLLTSRRVGPSVLGRGYIEAIADAEIERVEAEQAARSDGVHGRINRVRYHSAANPDTSFHRHQLDDTGLIGRFGLKARVAAIDDFTADAFQGDMGITSPLRPSEPANPDHLADDARPGLDLDIDEVNLVAGYVRLLEIPRRAPEAEPGRAPFVAAGCAVCHVPSLKTRADYPIAQLAGIDAPVFTDLLLHDFGPNFADGMTDENAKSSEWRTAPLIGMRFQRSYLHDGRAKTVEEAITLHEGQAAASVTAFHALSEADRTALITFVSSL